MANPLANWGLKKTATNTPVKDTKDRTALFVDPHTQQTYIYTSESVCVGDMIEVETRKGRRCCQVVTWMISNDNVYSHIYKVYLSLIDDDDLLIFIRSGRS
jgi:hypothetical protein